MNIILLISDTFRYDNLLGRARGMAPRTPCLDAFHARSVSLSRMYMSSFPTIPHRTDLTTGRFGWPWYGWQPLHKSGKNHLPQMLGKAGYVTQLIGDCPHVFYQDFFQAFDGWSALRGQEGDKPLVRMNRPFKTVMPEAKTRSFNPKSAFGKQALPNLHRWTNLYYEREEECFAPRTARMVIEWLEENYRHDPFFLWADFFDPHEPWDPPEYLVRRYDPDYQGTPMIHPNYGKASEYSPEELRNLRAHYCAESELVDRWIGRVLEKIDDLDLWKNSIIIFLSDHGMSTGEHNRTGKSNINDRDERPWPVYPEVAHENFMLAAPGLPQGKTVDALLQPPDIAPTLLELAGVPAEPPDPFHGRSFAPLLRGERGGSGREFAITASHLRKGKPGFPAKETTPVLYTKKWAYAPIGQDGKRELFDLEADYYAEKNVIAGQESVAQDLHAKLLGWLEELEAPAEAIEAIGR